MSGLTQSSPQNPNPQSDSELTSHQYKDPHLMYDREPRTMAGNSTTLLEQQYSFKNKKTKKLSYGTVSAMCFVFILTENK